jgi:branched-chain amino acid aminotransferase
MSGWIYLNDRFIAAGDAMIPVADRGFRFGDGVFETIAIHHGHPYQWAWHKDRLQQGLDALRIPMPGLNWDKQLDLLLEKNELQTGFVRIAVSRGVGSAGYLPLDGIAPTVVIETLTASPPANPAILRLSRHRRPSASSFPVHIKSAQGLTSTLALLEAREDGCDEALLLDAQDHLSEAASANLFWMKNGVIYTPSLSTGCVMGSTRAAIMRLSPLPVQEVEASVSNLQQAELVWLTNCRVGIWPVQQLAPQDWQWPVAHSLFTDLKERYRLDIEQASR